MFAYFGEMPNIPDSVTCCSRFADRFEKVTGQAYQKNDADVYTRGIRESRRSVIASVWELASTMDAMFTGICLPELQAGQLGFAGAGGVTNNRTVNMGGLTVNVNGYNARNDDDLADTVVQRINDMLGEDDSVWGR